jgi:hypothetical protein
MTKNRPNGAQMKATGKPAGWAAFRNRRGDRIDELGGPARRGETRLDTLSGQFDDLLARMQTPKARPGLRAAFTASPKQLGKAAVGHAPKRG